MSVLKVLRWLTFGKLIVFTILFAWFIITMVYWTKFGDPFITNDNPVLWTILAMFGTAVGFVIVIAVVVFAAIEFWNKPIIKSNEEADFR